MSADGRRYTGANQAGVAIVGVRSVIGWWEHRVADGAASMLRLLPDGKINAPDGPNTWKLTGDTLEMRWQDPAAPGGAWVDTVKLDAGRATYEGKNQTGVRLRGWQVASE
jgi:hypothetical protein